MEKTSSKSNSFSLSSSFRALALLLGLGLFSPAFAETDLNCKKGLADIAAAASSFLIRVNGVNAESAPSVESWHQELVSKARKLLDAQETKYEVHEIEKGLIELEILPLKGVSALNDYAYHREKDLDGIRIFYSPIRLVRSEGRIARAAFIRSRTTALMPHAQIANAEAIHDSLEHEIMHGAFLVLRKRGIDTFLSGWLRAPNETPLWPEGAYYKHMALEELATHPLNLKRQSEKLASQLERDEATWADARIVVNRAANIEKLARRSGNFVRQLLLYLETHPGQLLNLKGKSETPDGFIDPLYFTNWKHGEFVIKIPWVTGKAMRAARSLTETKRESKKNQIARHYLRRQMTKKLKKFAIYAAKLEFEARRVREIGELAAPELLEILDKAEADRMVDAARELWNEVQRRLPAELPF